MSLAKMFVMMVVYWIAIASLIGGLIYGAVQLYFNHEINECTTSTFNICLSKVDSVEADCRALAERQCVRE